MVSVIFSCSNSSLVRPSVPIGPFGAERRSMVTRFLLLPLALLACTHLFTANLSAATITVNSSEILAPADDGFCTLDEAVEAANSNTASGILPGECAAGEAGPVQDVIDFEPALFPTTFFTVGTLDLNESVSIQGPGAAVMSLTNLTETRAFNIQNFQANAEFEISGLTLENNVLRTITGDYGGAILASLIADATLLIDNVVFFNNTSERGGGAIGLFGGNTHSITIRNCLFENNRAGNFGNGNVIGGGAIFVGSSQSLVIENSSFINNDTFHAALAQPQSDAAGGAILIRSAQTLTSTVDIFQSTFSGNAATGVGGAIALGGPGFPSDISELSLRHSTLVLNESDNNDDQSIAGGGGVWSASSEPVRIYNSIVAQNIDNADTAAPDLHGSMNTFGFNLIGDNSTVSGVFPVGQSNANDDWVGSSAAPLDPMLEALAYSGGPTPVHQPMLVSPLLDQGKCASRITDQRLFQNVQTGFRVVDITNFANADDGCDIGAVERFGVSADPVPEANDDSYIAFEDQPLVISAASGLLNNDLDDDPLIVIDVRPVDENRGRLSGQVTATTDGAFVFETMQPDTSGLAEFLYVISDNLNTDSATLLIDVLPVNDAPGFNAATTTVSAASGQSLVVENWATEAGAGPAGEQEQSMQFLISPVSVPSGFFSSMPSIDFTNNSTANLSFELAPGAAGSAVVSVVLQDNGGVANGGSNQSEEVLLTIQALSDLLFSDRFDND